VSVTVVGWVGTDPDDLSARQLRALARAELVFAPERAHAPIRALAPRAAVRALPRPLTELPAMCRGAGEVAVVASGDPGFFGVTRLLAGVEGLVVLPGPTTVGVAAARLGRSWERASVVSFVGRDPERALCAAAEALARPDAVVVLLEPGQELGSLGRLVREHGRRSWLLVALGSPAEVVREGWEDDERVPTEPSIAWIDAREPERRTTARRVVRLDVFAEVPEHSAGVFSSLEVRLALVARLGPEQLPPGAEVLEVGAGSGYVGLALWRLRPDVRLTQLEPRHDRAGDVEANAAALGAPVRVRVERIEDHEGGPYDAAIVGGGGLGALRSALSHLRPGAPVVASYVDPARAGAAHEVLGNLELIEVARAVPTEPEGCRFVGRTPIFVAWGRAGSA